LLEWLSANRSHAVVSEFYEKNATRAPEWQYAYETKQSTEIMMKS